MHIETWFAFVVAAGILLVIPGPTIMLVITQAIAHGRRAVIPLVCGVVLGDFTAMTLSLAGLGAVLKASAALFAVLKWFGVGYLVYLGVNLWRVKPEVSTTDFPDQPVSLTAFFRNAFVVTALNPKSIVFFVAFLPQFVVSDASPALQFVVLGITFLLLGATNATLYGLFAGQFQETLQSVTMRRWMNRCGGSILIGAGVFTALSRHASS